MPARHVHGHMHPGLKDADEGLQRMHPPLHARTANAAWHREDWQTMGIRRTFNIEFQAKKWEEQDLLKRRFSRFDHESFDHAWSRRDARDSKQLKSFEGDQKARPFCMPTGLDLPSAGPSSLGLEVAFKRVVAKNGCATLGPEPCSNMA